MYPSSASSSSQGSMGSGGGGRRRGDGGLMHYGSAPGSTISEADDSVVGANRDFTALGTQPDHRTSRFFGSETSESTAMANRNDVGSRRIREEQINANPTTGLQTSFAFGRGGGVDGGGAPSLFRHSSSPAGSLNQLAAAASDGNGFSITRSIGSYNSKGMAVASGGIAINNDDNNNHKKSTRSYAATSGVAAAYGMRLWPKNATKPIMYFSVAPTNRGKTNVVDALDNMETQIQFSISQTAEEMTSTEKLLNIPEDSTTCKVRAKRGCATHPRSIAERERRTRISVKLKKLQDLVPNMDKQTSYADMLDLAVQHIKTLQNEVQKLNHELDNCTCGCKKTRDS